MTMKEGTGSDPFAHDGDEEETPEPTPDSELDAESEPELPMSEMKSSTQQQSLPYIHARDNVKEGRAQKPIFLRDPSVVEDLVDQMEDRIGEDVYKTDVLEAAVLAALSNPDVLEAELRDWGYGMR